jgi:predicted phage terminase large subunit-like protein
MTQDGTIVVANVVRGRWEWPAAVRMIADTARMDGPQVSQGVEVVGAQVGALQTLMADPLLAGLTFTPLQVHADKVTRALPVIARAEQGKLAIMRGGWNREFLDELSAFPETTHDDCVDSLSAAFTMLSARTNGAWTSEDIAACIAISAHEKLHSDFGWPEPGTEFPDAEDLEVKF